MGHDDGLRTLSTRILSLYLLQTFLFSHRSGWQVIAQLRSPAWPLAVKNPYLNTWYLPGTDQLNLNAVWPNMWPGASTNTSWYCGVMVDGKAYRVMGDALVPSTKSTTQESVQMTLTQTTVVYVTGPVNVTLNFLTPITATDLTRQSLPFSYFSITAESTDKKTHTVTIYSDITAEWISGDGNAVVDCVEDTQNDFVILQTSLQDPQPFVEINEHAQDSSSLFAMKNNSGVFFRAGVNASVRGSAMNSTGLDNSVDLDISSHPMNNPVDVFGISVDLGKIQNLTAPVVWAIGVIRDPSIRFTSLSGDVQLRSPYYRLNFTTAYDMVSKLSTVSYFVNDFDTATNASNQLDKQIAGHSADISSNLSDLLILVTRQAMSALEITVSKNPDGSLNSSDIMAFMKDMGSVGGGGVNAVDVMYAAFPMYLYLNPAIGGYLLKPLLVAQDTPQYSQPYAAQNLGVDFPNATAQNVEHNFGIEHSGSMLIMLLAHLQASGDTTLVSQHYNMVKGWANYLVKNSLNPGPQQTSISDGIIGIDLANLTNLSLKGIIGIGAMAKISTLMNMNDDALMYDNTAKSFILLWQNLSISQDQTQILSSFGDQNSSGIIYNLYADKLLQLGLVPKSAILISLSSIFIGCSGSNNFGIPLDSRTPNVTRADWMMFAAAASDDFVLQNALVSLVHSYAFSASNNLVAPISPIYDPSSGNSSGGTNSPAMGALFAALALQYVSALYALYYATLLNNGIAGCP
ncbi:DUF1793-domain-containing protein [Schizopora paradoxa]|uniref:DUF1793-domain-containing protein n=1 Tax=Schizopora paradoxa TaxID=27342 RepID=A0A0H2RIL1_9AGAM|nr:DUF1793-domain-containing protein [Schizopora paradoxa]